MYGCARCRTIPAGTRVNPSETFRLDDTVAFLFFYATVPFLEERDPKNFGRYLRISIICATPNRDFLAEALCPKQNTLFSSKLEPNYSVSFTASSRLAICCREDKLLKDNFLSKRVGEWDCYESRQPIPFERRRYRRALRGKPPPEAGVGGWVIPEAAAPLGVAARVSLPST